MLNPLFVDDIGKLVLRLTLGILILFHGVAKILHPAILGFITGKLANYGLPHEMAYLVYIGEVVAPLAIILGVYTRIGALVVMINMVFALVLVFPTQLLALSKTGGWAIELEGMYLFCALAVLLLGSGKVAVRPD
jgi:putative oxidoreductase